MCIFSTRFLLLPMWWCLSFNSIHHAIGTTLLLYVAVVRLSCLTINATVPLYVHKWKKFCFSRGPSYHTLVHSCICKLYIWLEIFFQISMVTRLAGSQGLRKSVPNAIYQQGGIKTSAADMHATMITRFLCLFFAKTQSEKNMIQDTSDV